MNKTEGIMKNCIFKTGKTMKKYIFALIASVMATGSVAQKLTPQEERDFYQKAYNMVNVYAQTSKLSDDRDVSQFTDLFKNSSMEICNDLMSLSYKQTLPVAEYIRLLREADMVKVKVSDVQKIGEIEEEDEAWLMSVSLKKRISFVNKCNTLFDSYDFFGHDFVLLMTIAMDKETRECHINELLPDVAIPEFPRDYRVLVKTDDRDNNLDVNGSYVNFVMDQKLLRPNDVLYYRGAKVDEKDMNDQCDHKVFADYSDKSWRVRVGGSFAVSGFNKLGNTSGIETPTNSEMGFGVDIGYVFPSTSHLRFGVFAGIGLSMNNLTMEFTPTGNDLGFEAPATADEDGNRYTRLYEMLDGKPITQEIKGTDITVPLYVDVEYEFNSIFSIYADAGVKLQTSSGEMTATTGEYKTWGRYPDYQNLEIGKAGDVKLNDFGTHSAIGVDEEGITKSMSIGGLLGVGLRINLNKAFALDAGVQYQMGGKSLKADNGSIFSYTLDGGDKVNLLRKAGDISHSALKVTASLIYKF